MLLLALGLALFLGVHAFTMARRPRAAVIGRVGEGSYKGAYALASLAGLVLIGQGFGATREAGMLPLWTPPAGARHLALALMLPAWVLLAATYLPGRIARAARHPMLAALGLWALAHGLANGDAGGLLLFGAFGLYAVAARVSLAARGEGVSHFVASGGGWRNDALALGLGVAGYLAFALWLHPLLIGVRVVG